jgi:hypothetical protein
MWHADCLKTVTRWNSAKLLIFKGFCALQRRGFDFAGTLDEVFLKKSEVAELGKRE